MSATKMIRKPADLRKFKGGVMGIEMSRKLIKKISAVAHGLALFAPGMVDELSTHYKDDAKQIKNAFGMCHKFASTPPTTVEKMLVDVAELLPSLRRLRDFLSEGILKVIAETEYNTMEAKVEAGERDEGQLLQYANFAKDLHAVGDDVLNFITMLYPELQHENKHKTNRTYMVCVEDNALEIVIGFHTKKDYNFWRSSNNCS